MSLLILTQYTDSHTSSFFSMPIWLTWSWSNAYCFSTSGTIMHLPFINTPSVTARSSLYDQYSFMSWCSWSFVAGQPDIILFFNCCRCPSWVVACCICDMDIHSRTSVMIHMASTLVSIPCIASSLFSL